MIREAEEFYLKKQEPNRGCLLALRKVIFRAGCKAEGNTEMGYALFLLRGKTVLLLVDGKENRQPLHPFCKRDMLHHPELETGKRTKMKILRVGPREDLPIETIRNILQRALYLY